MSKRMIKMVGQKIHDNLGIGFRKKLDLLVEQKRLVGLEILDNTIVDQCEFAEERIHMGMGIEDAHAPVCRPARMRDTVPGVSLALF